MKGMIVDYWKTHTLVSNFRSFLFQKGAGGFGEFKDPSPSDISASRKTLVLKIEEVPNGDRTPYVVGSLLTPWGKWLIAWTPSTDKSDPWKELVSEYENELGFTYFWGGSFWPRWRLYGITLPDVHESPIPL